MTARCTKCGASIHFGGRGTKLKDIKHCSGADVELITYAYVGFGYYKNKAGDRFKRENGFFIKEE